MKSIFAMIAAMTITAAAYARPRPPALTDDLLDAIRQVESSGNDAAIGDGGKAIGPYQIWRVYWIDACEFDPSLKSRPYEACFEPDYARRVVIAYLSMRKYSRKRTWTRVS